MSLRRHPEPGQRHIDAVWQRCSLRPCIRQLVKDQYDKQCRKRSPIGLTEGVKRGSETGHPLLIGKRPSTLEHRPPPTTPGRRNKRPLLLQRLGDDRAHLIMLSQEGVVTDDRMHDMKIEGRAGQLDKLVLES